MSEWPLVSLGEVADLIAGYPFESARFTADPTAPRLLRGDNVGQGVLRWDGAKRWPAALVDGLERYWLVPKDVIVAMDRPWIEAGLKFAAVGPADTPSLLVQRVSRLRGTSRLNARFLKHVIADRGFTEHVLAVQTGTTIPHISARQILDYRFYLPPLTEQRRIAKILGALDDKIDVNRRMEETLGCLCQALFNSIVLEGCKGDVTGSILGNEFEIVMGQSPPGYTYNAGGAGMPFYQGRVDFGFRYPSRRMFCSAPARLARAGDVLLSVRAPVGDINIALEACAIGRGVAAVRHPSAASAYTFEMLRYLRPALNVFNGEGTVFGSIGGSQLRALAVPKLAPEVVRAFESATDPIELRLGLLHAETNRLMAVRQTLLPRLLAGDLPPAARNKGVA